MACSSEPQQVARSLRLVLLGSRSALLLQALWLMGFSVMEFRHDDLTYDYSIFVQAGSKIARGQLDPFSSIKGFPFWQNHGEILMWVLAPLTRVPPVGLWLLFAQDLATVGIGWVLVTWVRDWTQSKSWPRQVPPSMVVALAAVMFVGNPWIYSAAAFDFHLQAFAVLTLVLAAKSMVSGHWRRAVLFIALTLAAGDVAGTYIFGLGLTGLLLGFRDRKHLKKCVAVAATGVGWTLLLSVVHANLGSNLTTGYGYLAGGTRSHPSLLSIAWGTVAHPTRLGHHLALTGSDLLLAVLPVGLVGLLTPWAVIPLLTLLANGAHSGTNFAKPGIFQALPIWPFAILGVTWLLARYGRLDLRGYYARVMTGLILSCWVFSALMLFPMSESGRLTVSTVAAATVEQDLKAIPNDAQIIVCDGISGWFGARDNVSIIMTNPFHVRLLGKAVYFVLAPHVGTEDGLDIEGVLRIAQSQLGAEVASSNNGVWVLRWMPPAGQRQLVLDAPVSGMPSS